MAKLEGYVYSQALFELGVETGRLKEQKEELQAIMKVFSREPEFLEFVESPVVTKSEKKEVLKAVFSNGISEQMMHFLFVLVDNNRTNTLGRITEDFLHLYRNKMGEADAIVESAIFLSEEEKEIIRIMLEKKSKKTVTISYVVNPDIIGGLRIQMGDYIMDSTLASDLKDLKSRIYQTIV